MILLLFYLVSLSNSYQGSISTQFHQFKRPLKMTTKNDSIANNVVQGLTDLMIRFQRNGDKSAIITKVKPSLTIDELYTGIRNDFRSGYLFSGSIDPEIYDNDCLFSDPTLSFQGLSTFQTNVAAVKPLANLFFNDTLIVLYNLLLNTSSNTITAQWRMSGSIYLPWKPRIELPGYTIYSYSPPPNGDNRIVRYDENWRVPALECLGQVLQPATHITETLSTYNKSGWYSSPLGIYSNEGVDNIASESKGDSKTVYSTACVDLMTIKELLFQPLDLQSKMNTLPNTFNMYTVLSQLRYAQLLGQFPASLLPSSTLDSQYTYESYQTFTLPSFSSALDSSISVSVSIADTILTLSKALVKNLLYITIQADLATPITINRPGNIIDWRTSYNITMLGIRYTIPSEGGYMTDAARIMTGVVSGTIQQIKARFTEVYYCDKDLLIFGGAVSEDKSGQYVVCKRV